MLVFRYDTQLLIDGENLDEDAISEYFDTNFEGDSLLAVGDEEMIKIHFHTNLHSEAIYRVGNRKSNLRFDCRISNSALR